MVFNCLVVGAGGFLGAVSRYLLGCAFPASPGAFPVLTLLINFAGAFVIAAVAECSRELLLLSPRTLLFLKTGLCGGFTTFSAFSLETFELFEGGKGPTGTLYAVSSVIACLAGIWLGRLAVRLLKQLIR